MTAPMSADDTGYLIDLHEKMRAESMGRLRKARCSGATDAAKFFLQEVVDIDETLRALRGDSGQRAHVTGVVLEEVAAERVAQHKKWGEQNHPNGTGPTDYDSDLKLGRWTFDAGTMKQWVDRRAKAGVLFWSDILAEEVAEAFAEDDPAKLREELIQIAAVAVAWVERVDRAAA